MTKEKIGLDKFCDHLTKMKMDFTDFILEDWESKEDGNVKLNGLTKQEWANLYLRFLKKMHQFILRDPFFLMVQKKIQ